jgi:hypothetical protein
MVIRMNAFTPVPSDTAASVSSEHPDIAAARALVERLSASGRRTAEVLEELRRAFPNSPLAVRVRALETLRPR